MANASQVYAYLDLPGNRLIWTPQNNNSDGLLLYGSNFTDPVQMASISVSALCLLCFIILLLTACVIRCSSGKALLFLPWYCGWLPILWMIWFFCLDLVNRVLHELELPVPIFYIAIDVPMGSSSSVADGLLMIWLLNNSPVNTKSAGTLARWSMVAIVTVFFLVSGATKGVQVWDVIEQATPPSEWDSTDESNDTGFGSTKYYTSLGTSAVGILLLFAICYAFFAVAFMKRLPTTNYLRKRLQWLVAIITTAFIVRSAVQFVFTLLYSQYNGTATNVDQLIYLAFYGILSVVIFTCVILVAHASRRDEGLWSTMHDYQSREVGHDEKVV